MRKTYLFLLAVIIGTVFSVNCEAQNDKNAGYYSYEIECLGVEGDGSQTLKTWGNGRNRADAIEQAKKNAVQEVLFKGIAKGKSECNQKPVIFEVNAREKYEDYFNKFFADGGDYQKFVSPKDGSKYHFEVVKDRKQAGSQETYAVIVRILRAELKAKMIEDKILQTN